MKGFEKIATGVFFVLLCLPFFFENSCKKPDSLPAAIITVLDSVTNAPVVNAKVRLQLDTITNRQTHANTIPPEPSFKMTDEKGEVKFTLKYEAAYFAEVTKELNKDTATDLVRFKKNDVTNLTILY